jgi:hypothetical protein
LRRLQLRPGAIVSKRKPRPKLREERSDASEPQWLIELWGVHQALRSLGFSADDIYVGFDRVLNVDMTNNCVFVSLRTQGKEFIYTVMVLPGMTEAEVFAQWSDFVISMRSVGAERMEQVYRLSQIGASMPLLLQFAAALTKKGYHIPELTEQLRGDVAALLAPDPPPIKPIGNA